MNALELRDIHLPDAVSWWPPAIGWWLLILLCFFIVIVIFMVIKKMKQVSVRKTAINEFASIKLMFQQQKDKTQLSQQLSQLLRQVLLSSMPREDVASVTGEQWLKLLNKHHPKGKLELEWINVLSISAYQKSADYNADSLLNHIELWLNTYPKRYLL